MKFSKKLMPAVFIFCCIFSSIWLEAEEKRLFTIDDYASWRSISSTSISDDGQWVTYAYRKTKADDEFFIKSLVSDKKYKVIGASDPKFSDDSCWAAYTLNLPQKETEKLRKQKKPVPRKAELIHLSTGEKKTFENASSFSFSKGSGYLAVKKTKADPKAKHKGTDLILYKLKVKAFHNLGNVAEFKFNKPGTHLAYIVDAADKSGNGLYLFNLSQGTLTVLDAGKADYSQLTWNEKGTAMAALKGEKQKEFKKKDNILLAFTGVGTKNQASHMYDPAKDTNFPQDMVISELTVSTGRSRFRRSTASVRGNLFWSEDNTQIFCGLKE
jgi:hypothetical protein